MKNKLSNIIKNAYKNNYLSKNRGTVSIKGKDKNYFYITERNLINKNMETFISKIYLEKNFYEVNVDIKNKINSEVDFHGKSMVNHYDKEYIILHLYPKNVVNFMKNNKLSNLNLDNFKLKDKIENNEEVSEIIGLGKNGIIAKTNDIKNVLSKVEELEELTKEKNL